MTAPAPCGPDRLALRALDISRSFAGVRAVDGVSLDVPRGQLTGLIGPNGAGKSTVLAMLAGSLVPDSGRILLGSRDITRLPLHERARLGLLRTFQQTSEFPSLTVIENLVVAAKGMRGETLRTALFQRRAWRESERKAVQRASELLSDFGLEAHANTPAGMLSGGQRRLVEVMRGMMAEPQVLLLDEPMAGVHPALVEQLGDSLLQLRDSGMAVVMVEHELTVVDRLCDSVVVMAAGKVVAQGAMDDLRKNTEVVEAYLVG